MQFAIRRERGARRWGVAACGAYGRIAHATSSCAVFFGVATTPSMLRGGGGPIVCIMSAQGIIHVATCHYARIQLRMQSSQLDTCCRQCSVSCPTTHLHLYFLWGSNPRPVAHKTIASATELRELHAIKKFGRLCVLTQLTD